MADNENRYDMLNGADREEEIRIRKIRQGVIENTENENYLKEKEERENAPVSFKDKFKNFWFHYKTTVIICSLVAAAITFLTVQGINKERYDATVLFCTHMPFLQESIEGVEAKLGDYFSDVDNNGEVNVSLYHAYYKQEPDEYIATDDAMRTRIMAEIAVGENCLFIVENDILEDLSSKGAFLDLREVLDIKSNKPVYSVSIKDSKLFEADVFDKERENYYLAIRVYKEGTSKESYNAQLEALKKIYEEIK